jgi:selenocysteine-specific elongation factor
LHVVGTAGHVDHGKSTLVRALTGIDPDRLKEEKEREMTIDLGFAWLTLPNGEQVGLVDVPGHKDFIKNMLAGVGGIDATLFIVAADEGVMPQTREHLAILDLLGVETGVVVITKKDLVEDEEWLELVMAEVSTELEGTCLESAPMVPVSARTGEGVPELIAELQSVLSSCRRHRDDGRPRVPIDRVFSVAGFGTVVTGTLIDGQLRVGQEVEVLPRGLKARIRGLQTHKEKLEVAFPSSRVAVNLTGVAVTDLERGDVLTFPGWLAPTQLIDVRLRHLGDAPWPLKHNAVVDFHSGAAQLSTVVRLLETEALEPGQTGWAQLRLERPAVLRKGDRFILRQPSPSLTVGGGVVVNAYPRRRYRRFRREIVEQLETQAHGSPDEILLQALEAQQPSEVRELLKRSALPNDVAIQALSALLGHGEMVLLGNSSADTPAVSQPLLSAALVMSLPGWRSLMGQAAAYLKAYHVQYPLRRGMPKEELKSRLRLPTRVFNEIILSAVRERSFKEHEAWVSLPEHEVEFDPGTQRMVDQLLSTFRRQPYATPSVADSEKAIGADVLGALIEQGMLVKVNTDVLFLRETYDEMVARVADYIRANGSITVAQVRDMFEASRKYALGLMEYLDEKKITRRQGDVRVLR